MKKKTLVRSILLAFLCCMMILGFQTNVKAETGNYYIKVNKSTNVVTVYTKDDKPYTAFVCSAGYATPTGTFHTMNKYSWWVLDGPSYGQYCTRITGSILFHSVWYYEQNKTTQSYVQYNKLGSLASHGSGLRPPLQNGFMITVRFRQKSSYLTVPQEMIRLASRLQLK